MAEPLQALTMQAAVDLLPGWARRMHGLPEPIFSAPWCAPAPWGWRARCAGRFADASYHRPRAATQLHPFRTFQNSVNDPRSTSLTVFR